MRPESSHINQYRNRTHPIYKSDDSLGMTGFFVIPLNGHTFALIIASEGEAVMPWEHVSVRIGDMHKNRMRERVPTWAEMCVVKDIFFSPEECVMQLHPPQSQYVNTHPCVLHLWRPLNEDIPQPPKVAV